MSASSSRCGAIVSQSEKARNANSFFDRLAELLNSESVETTNRDDMEPPLRAKMRLAMDHLQQMIRLARQFHQYRFSDDPQRCGMAAEVAGKLVYLHNKLHRGHNKLHQSDVGADFLQMVTLFDRRAKYTPQPGFFGFHHKSWAGVVNKIMLQHYCPFDDAFEASALSEGITAKQQESGESESALWTPEAFALLCQRLDENPLQILSFTKSSWGVEQEPGKQSAGDNAAGGQGVVNDKPPTGAEFVFRPDGDGYFLSGFGESGHVTAKGAKGLHDLFRLVQTPGVPVPMLKLDAGPGVERAEGDWRSPQPVADGVTIKQLAAKRNQLKADIESAGSDMERSELETELAELEKTAKGMSGLNGTPRDLNNPLDRLRPKLLKRISTAGKKLREANLDKLAEHFGPAVTSESGCMVYRPAVEGLTWNVTKVVAPKVTK